MKLHIYVTAAELETIWAGTTRGEWGWLDDEAPDDTVMMFEREDDPDAWDYDMLRVNIVDDYGDWQCVSDARWPVTELGEPAKNAEFTAIRRALRWSQPATAEALGRSTSWVRRVEQGQIPCPKYAVYAMRWLQLHPDHASTSAP